MSFFSLKIFNSPLESITFKSDVHYSTVLKTRGLSQQDSPVSGSDPVLKLDPVFLVSTDKVLASVPPTT